MVRRPDKIKQISIRTKVALTTLITVLITLGCVSGGLFFYFHNLLCDSIFQQQFVMVSEIAENLDGRIKLARHQLSLAATELNSQVLADPDKLEQALNHVSSISMIFDAGFLVIGANGRVLAESIELTGLLGTDLSFRDYVKEPLQKGKPFLSDPFRSVLPGHIPMIAMSVPVRDDTDRIIALMVGFHSLGNGQFLTGLSSRGVGGSGYLYLLHERTIIMHPDKKRILETIAPGKNRGIDQALNGMEGSLDNVNSKGQHMLSSFKKINETDWILASNVPYDEAFAPLNKLAFNAVLISVGGLTLSLLVIWYVTRRLTRPIEYLITHVDGVCKPGEEWKPLELKTGDELELLAHAFNGMMEEVTLAQQRLQDEKVFVENLINSASTPIFVINSRHGVLYWNRALEIITGKMASDLKGTNQHWSGFYDISRKTLADLILDGTTDLTGLYKTYSPSKYIAGGFQAEGWFGFGSTRRYLLFEAAPIRNSDGKIVAVIETLEDITDRRHMEESLSRLTRAVEQSPATIVMTDVHGTIEYVNPKFCETSGYSFKEAIGQNTRVLKSGETSSENYSTLWKTIAFGKEWHGEFHNKRKDGSLYWEFASISPLLDNDGLITGYLAVKEDITERKLVEMELQKAYTDLKEAQLQIFQQEKMASIGQLAAGVAHEINNPMGFISSNLSTLNKYIDRLGEFITIEDQVLQVCSCGIKGENLAEERKRLKIDYIMGDARQLILESQDGASRVRRIVQDLKSFSRVDQAEQELTNLNEALETTINIAWNEIKYVATINREFGDIPEIFCFPQQLNQVFLNLLVNAGHALENSQGSITIRTWCESGYVFIVVADTGCGIPDSIRQRIFEPFFTTKDVGKGTGLGLSISYDIIRKHGGEITVESEAGQGTSFTVRLPVAGKSPRPES